MSERTEVAIALAKLLALSAFSYLTARWMFDLLDPTRRERKVARARARKMLRDLGVTAAGRGGDAVNLDEHELTLAANLVRPEDMATSWADIAGLDRVVAELRETVILPIRHAVATADGRLEGMSSELTRPPIGVLLHGPPGCGKTMIARATAQEAGARFINLDGAAVQDKWYGESQKLVGALFSLARKLQPTIVFIDEIDSLLRARDSRDHEATAMIKAQFMQLWDGLSSDNQQSVVVVMGATNRPRDVDRAILRRMPATFHVGLPDAAQRKAILKRILAMEDEVDADVDYNRLAQLTDKYSGSDLRELCRTAAVYRLKELDELRSHPSQPGVAPPPPSSPSKLRPINNADLLAAAAKLRESKLHCTDLADSFPMD